MKAIKKYLTDEKKMSDMLINKTIEKLQRNPDIMSELEDWIEERVYKGEDGISIDGYNAEKIFTLAPFLDGLGVFNFLITLREQPDKAKEYIENGFPRK